MILVQQLLAVLEMERPEISFFSIVTTVEMEPTSDRITAISRSGNENLFHLYSRN